MYKKRKLHPIPATGYLRLNQIIGDETKGIPAIIPIGRTAWLDGVKIGIYPQPVKLGKRTTGWKVEDILELIEDLNAGYFQ